MHTVIPKGTQVGQYISEAPIVIHLRPYAPK
jgi:hypothetical protein